MSRSDNQNSLNPSKLFFQWNGNDGGFFYFDKNMGEKGERVQLLTYDYDNDKLLELRKNNGFDKKGVQIPLTEEQVRSTILKKNPFRFMVLDTLSTIKGFDEPNKSGFYSNEVRDLKTEILRVKNKNGVVYEGLYENLNVAAAKYGQSVYICYKLDGKYEICNIQMVGAAVSSWIEFVKKNRDVLSKGAICVEDFKQGEKGGTKFQSPVFKKILASPEAEAEALKLDAELKKYLTAYFSKNHSEKQVEEIHKEVVKDETITDAKIPYDDNTDEFSEPPF